MFMKASDYIAKFFEINELEYCFELSGGMIAHLLDSFSKTTVNIISMHHEQSAGFAAEGYARTKGSPGLALATSGPGATNLLTAIGSCYFDSIPCVFITGQVNRHEMKGIREIRQLGFQETDIVAMAAPVVKRAFQIEHIDQLEYTLIEAWNLTTEGRPGPVLIDIPMDIQRFEIDASPIKSGSIKSHEVSDIENDYLSDFCNDLEKSLMDAEKPLMLLGGGAVLNADLTAFIDSLKIPVVTTLLGKDRIASQHSLWAGFIGSYGNRWANRALEQCDLLIVLGSRLDIRQTGANLDPFELKNIFHIDVDQHEINNRIKGCHGIRMKSQDFTKYFNSRKYKISKKRFEEWRLKIDTEKSELSDLKELKGLDLNPNEFMKLISEMEKSNHAGYTVDVGSHQMWAAQSIRLKTNEKWFTSGGMGAMGFSIPCAIGMAFASNRSTVTCILGDGCFQINSQDLDTISAFKLPIKIVLINNSSLGMITQFQDSYFNSNYQSTIRGYTHPDFIKVAEAYGIRAKVLSSSSETEQSLEWLYCDDKPKLLEVIIPQNTKTYPKIAFGRSVGFMEPNFTPTEIEST
jgi:acetolactate synthase I/II/III large subunit